MPAGPLPLLDAAVAARDELAAILSDVAAGHSPDVAGASATLLLLDGIVGEETGTPPPQRCRVCACTDDTCQGCYERTGESCWWVEEDLCSACQGGAVASAVEDWREAAFLASVVAFAVHRGLRAGDVARMWAALRMKPHVSDARRAEVALTFAVREGATHAGLAKAHADRWLDAFLDALLSAAVSGEPE